MDSFNANKGDDMPKVHRQHKTKPGHTACGINTTLPCKGMVVKQYLIVTNECWTKILDGSMKSVDKPCEKCRKGE